MSVLPVIGWSLLGTGTVLLAIGGGLAYAGVRRPRARPRQEAPAVAAPARPRQEAPAVAA